MRVYNVNFVITAKIKKKLIEKHHVVEEEMLQCFANRTKGFLEDKRANHRTDPPTRWFISESDFGRRLKIVFVLKFHEVHIKSVFEPNDTEERIYEKFAK